MGAKKSKIKAVIFDLWGTILENAVYPSPTKQSKKILGLFDMNYSDFVMRFEKAFMTSKYNDISEGLSKVFEEFDVNPEEYNRVDKLIGLWNKAKILSKLYPDTLYTLNTLKKDYKLILLSNLPCTQIDILERFGFKNIFDYVFLSFEIGSIKSEGGFEKVIKKTKLKPEEMVMVGDSIESDMMGAKKAGIKGILIDKRNSREYDIKVSTLSEIPRKIEEVAENG